jgi:hypothetical protein
VTHSKNTQVAAYTSVAGDAGSPFHCSGAMYAGVPDRAPSPEKPAIPKSISLLSPSAWTTTLAGL